MTEMMTVNETKKLSVYDYEARIHLYREQIGVGYIGIGRTLNEAKASGVVPEGQWEAWMTEVTGLTVRQAQRCMQAAREIKDGSNLARLEMSKAMRLLSSGLNEDQREELAAKASQDELTVKELEAEIRKLKTGQEQAVNLARDWEKRAREAFDEGRKAAERAGQVEDNLRVIEAEEKARKKIAMLDEARQAAIDQAQALRKERNDLSLRQDELRIRLHEMEQRASHAEDQLKRRQGADQEQYRIGREAGKAEAENEAAQLRAEIDEQRRRMDEQRNELNELRRKDRERRMNEARGNPSSDQAAPGHLPPWMGEGFRGGVSKAIMDFLQLAGRYRPEDLKNDGALPGQLAALETWVGLTRMQLGVPVEGVVL